MAYRILSLDGGGSWALIQVKALIKMYGPDKPGRKVLQDFDMAAANSGGSIVLAGLVENLTLSEILGYFENEALRKAMFSPTDSLVDRALHSLTGLGPKYSARNKLPGLQHLMPEYGNRPLSEAIAGVKGPSGKDVHLLIVSFDYDRNRAAFFRSSEVNAKGWGMGEIADITLAEAAHASSNAPVNYFDAPAEFPDHPGRYWDGAISGCNNPVLAGVTEAIGKGTPPSDIIALSLGTAAVALPWLQPGETPSSYTQPTPGPGLKQDILKLATSILDEPPDISTFLAHVMTGSGATAKKPADSCIVRMNPLISPVRNDEGWAAPGPLTAAQFNYLAQMDMDAVQQAQVDAISKFADLWLNDIVLNQPIRMDGDTLKPELGPMRFKEALLAWNALSGLHLGNVL